MTAMGDEQLAVNALKSGFVDYVVKSDIAFRDLPHIIEGAYEKFLALERMIQIYPQEHVQINDSAQVKEVMTLLPNEPKQQDSQGFSLLGSPHLKYYRSQ